MPSKSNSSKIGKAWMNKEKKKTVTIALSFVLATKKMELKFCNHKDLRDWIHLYSLNPISKIKSEEAPKRITKTKKIKKIMITLINQMKNSNVKTKRFMMMMTILKYLKKKCLLEIQGLTFDKRLLKLINLC